MIQIKIKNRAAELGCKHDFENSKSLLKHCIEIIEKLKIKLMDEDQLLPTSCCDLSMYSLEDMLMKFENLSKLISHKLRLDFHREIAIRQRKAYNFCLSNKDYLKNNLVIDFDYKQKLPIGLGPFGQSFFKQRTISYLTFGVYYVLNNEIKCINYDILSDNLKQDGNAVIRAFRFIRQLDSFKKIDKKKYSIFCDCGSHFRNSEVIFYCMNELAFESILVSINFFAPKHGKSKRDQHLSLFGYFLRKVQKSLTTIEEVCDFINTTYKRSNKIRRSTKHVTFAYKLNPSPKSQVLIQERVIARLTEFFNLRNLITNENGHEEIKLYSSQYSDVVVNLCELTGVVPVESYYKRYSKELYFNEPEAKKIIFPLENEKKLKIWKRREKRMKKRYRLCMTAQKVRNLFIYVKISLKFHLSIYL